MFDDRLVDPVEGRCVMHGHIEESGPIIAGALSREAVGQEVRRAIERFAAERLSVIPRYHGSIVFRLAVSPKVV